jgi:protease-4
MKGFFKMTLATLTGLLIFGFVMTSIIGGIIGGLAAIGKQTAVVPASAVLTMDMSTITLAEQTIEMDPLSMIQSKGTEIQPLGIYSAIQAINIAAEDPAIKYIYMKPDRTSGGIAQIEELRTALVHFRERGKAIVSYIESPSNAAYYLASVSDKIYMTCHDGGMNNFCGISSNMMFLKDLLDKLGINVQLIRHGKYKSAGEMFIRNSPSKENMEQNKAMINSIWNSWASAICTSRVINLSDLNAMLDNLELNFPSDFLAKGLVDELVTREEMREKLTALYVADKPENVKTISLQDYAKARTAINLNPKGKVAVIYVDGDIVDGKEMAQVAGDRFAKIIAEVRNDSTVKAAVLRVNSPGGSVLASEKIKTEVALLQERMPVAASYGNYAASGGYWISAGCDKIFSNATTLTGSIGVFSMIPDFSKTVETKLHVGMTPVKSNKHADMYGLMRPLTNKEAAYMQASVEQIYTKFTTLVAEGREMTVARVDEIAQGRVWSGAEALDIKLVDQIGTIEDAITWAAMTIEGVESVKDVEIVGYPKPLTSIEMLLESLNQPADQNILAGTAFKNVGEAFSDWKATATGKVYARMPFEYTIQ